MTNSAPMPLPLIAVPRGCPVFSPDLYRASCESYRRENAVLDGTLRRLCADHPGHSDFGEVSAKVWIVSRTYVTQIEWHIKSDGAMGSSLGRLVTHLNQRACDVDACIGSLPEPNSPTLEDAHIPAIVGAHGVLSNIIGETFLFDFFLY